MTTCELHCSITYRWWFWPSLWVGVLAERFGLSLLAALCYSAARKGIEVGEAVATRT